MTLNVSEGHWKFAIWQAIYVTFLAIYDINISDCYFQHTQMIVLMYDKNAEK